MRYKLLLIGSCFLGLFCWSAQAQYNRFITSGTIEYDKSINMYAIIPRISRSLQSQQEIEMYRKSQPQFLLLKSTLTFSRNKTLFEPHPHTSLHSFNSSPVVTQNNIVYNNLSDNETVSQKNLFGELFLLKDQGHMIKWKITDETRDIAGFPCRRANGLMMDSIYVVAFYTSKIPVPGGPESFHGLPGMILQVAVPRENISWIATKITDMTVPVVSPPTKGKPFDRTQLKSELETSLSRFGNAVQVYLKAFLL